MDEHVYAVPDLTTDIRYGPRERGEREERIVDIYVSADNLNPDPGTQQDAVQQNTAQEQHGGKKRNATMIKITLCNFHVQAQIRTQVSPVQVLTF